MSSGLETATARIFAPAWLTTWPMSYRSSMRGFTISARWPAISARRSRRINSSLLPLNIGAPTTSSQPPRSGRRRIIGLTLTVRPDGLLGLVERPAREQAQADDSERAAVLDHRQVPEVAGEHDLRGVLDRRLGLDRHRIGRHPLAYASLGCSGARRDGPEQVALRDDPDDPHHVFEHDDRTDVRRVHLLGGLSDRVGGLDGENVLDHQVRD